MENDDLELDLAASQQEAKSNGQGTLTTASSGREEVHPETWPHPK